MSLAHDLVTEAAAALDYDSYVYQPDGSVLTQSSARDAILRLCRMLELQPGLRVLTFTTASQSPATSRPAGSSRCTPR